MPPLRSRARRAFLGIALFTVPVLVLATLPGCDSAGDAAATTRASHPAKPRRAARTTPPSTAKATPTPAPTAVAAVNPCSLVTKPEAERLAGTPLQGATRVDHMCSFTAPTSGPAAQVEVFVGDGAKKYLDIERQLEHELRPLAQLGDEAYAEEEAVFLRRGGLWVTIHLVRLNDPKENRAPLEHLARQVATRI